VADAPSVRLAAVKKLDFTQPPFCRIAWVSDQARAAWQPVLADIARARPRIFAAAVRAGLYRCALLRIPGAHLSGIRASLAEMHGLAVEVLDDSTAVRECVIGDADAVAEFRTAGRNTQADLLGVPECCRRFQDQIRSVWGFADLTLPRALNTPGAAMVDGTIRIPSAGLLNTILTRIEMGLLSYEPCSMACPPSLRLAEAWLACGRAGGFERETAALSEVLRWPVEWSGLHGIAEIKTPILKISANTDATGEPYRVQLVSARSPQEGAPGLRFPYEQPRRAAAMNRVIVPSGVSATPVAPGGPAKPAPAVTLAPRPRSAAILDETFARVRKLETGAVPAVRTIYLSNYFNALQLDDLSVGAAMNYCRFKSEDAVRRAVADLEAKLPSDPLLLDYLFAPGEPDLLQLSLKTCLVSALSRQHLRQPAGFRVQTAFDPGLLPDVRSAVVVGFGGYMDYLIRRTGTCRIHVSDLDYIRRAKRMDAAMDWYRRMCPDKEITVSDGSDTRQRLASADLVSITGSAFCSGTMDELLEAARRCETVIVQGQSASVIPEVLFERGVTLMSTTIKPNHLIEVGRTDRDEFRALLEGKLRPIFMMPAKGCLPAPTT
jgi:Putative heavy-metal chelation